MDKQFTINDKTYYSKTYIMTHIARELNLNSTFAPAWFNKLFDIKYPPLVVGNGKYYPQEALDNSVALFTSKQKSNKSASDAGKYGSLKAYVNRLEDRIKALEALHKDELSVHNDASSKPIDEIDFSVRTYNCLKKEGIVRLGQLSGYTESDIYRLPNLGRRSLNEIKSVMAEHGLELKKANGFLRAVGL